MKFQVGDKVKNKKYEEEGVITSITNDGRYNVDYEWLEFLEDEDDILLVTPPPDEIFRDLLK